MRNSLTSILSRLERNPEPVEGRSENRIEGCDSRQIRTLRYALHPIPRYSGCSLINYA